MKIAVIALGKIGLPLAVQFASKGHDVIGVDVNQATVDLVNQGLEPFPGEEHLAGILARVVTSRQLHATTDYADAISGAEVVVVVVPLFVDGDANPEFEWMDSATDSIAAHLMPGTLVSYETTLPVGTTRERWKPRLEAGSGLSEGTDFHLVFSPERVLTGRVFADLRKYPKLVGGLSEKGTRQAIEFYESVLDFDERADLSRTNGVWDLGSAEAAEMSKLAETTYRDVNIGLANEFARYADTVGIDVYRVIEACNSQPYSHIHHPGIAVGGHCIPVYPRLYLWNDPEATIVRAARKRNSDMPNYAVGLLESVYDTLRGARVTVLGASYRGGVKETAFSGVFALVAALKEKGAEVMVHDPLYSDEELSRFGFVPFQVGTESDVAILQADHAEYRSWGQTELPGITTLMDGRKALDPLNWPDANYLAIGTRIGRSLGGVKSQ